jgi:hypothetical protein
VDCHAERNLDEASIRITPIPGATDSQRDMTTSFIEEADGRSDLVSKRECAGHRDA